MAEGSRAERSNLRGSERDAGLAFARAWRVRMKPVFDAIYGPEEISRPCPTCGQSRVVVRG